MERETTSPSWTEPEYGTLYLLYDEGGVPYALATYLDLVMCVAQDDVALWPQSQVDVDTLLWSFDAWETGRSFGELEIEPVRREYL